MTLTLQSETLHIRETILDADASCDSTDDTYFQAILYEISKNLPKKNQAILFANMADTFLEREVSASGGPLGFKEVSGHSLPSKEESDLSLGFREASYVFRPLEMTDSDTGPSRLMLRLLPRLKLVRPRVGPPPDPNPPRQDSSSVRPSDPNPQTDISASEPPSDPISSEPAVHSASQPDSGTPAARDSGFHSLVVSFSLVRSLQGSEPSLILADAIFLV